MKKPLVLTAAVALVLATGGAAVAAGEIQQLDAYFIPTKLDDRKFTPAKLFVDVFTASNDESAANGKQPPTARRMRLDLARNLRFAPGAVPRCKVPARALRGEGAARQAQLCGRASKVSIDSGSGAEITWDPTPVLLPGDSTVTEAALQIFNGRKRNTLYFAIDPDGPETGPVLIGKLRRSDVGRAYGRQLDLGMAAPSRGAFSDLRFTIKQGNFLRARCRSRKNRFLLRTNFTNHSPFRVADATVCKRTRS